MRIKNLTIHKIQSSGSDSFGKLLDVSEIPKNAKGYLSYKHWLSIISQQICTGKLFQVAVKFFQLVKRSKFE